MTDTDSQLDFETSLSKLEEIVAELEKGELPLDVALSAYEQGIKLTKHCEQALSVAEQKVQKLMNETTRAPFKQEEDADD